MGAEADASWLIDAAGYEVGCVGLNATLRDYGRTGLLLANQGVVGGQQIVPAAWVRAMTRPDAPHLRFGAASQFSGYGYQTWLIDPHEPYFALLGIRGQGIFVDPVTKVVAIFIAAQVLNDFASRRQQYALFYEILRSLASQNKYAWHPCRSRPSSSTAPRRALRRTQQNYLGPKRPGQHLGVRTRLGDASAVRIAPNIT